jgi:transcriptional regulator with XRE-family HTH domain
MTSNMTTPATNTAPFTAYELAVATQIKAERAAAGISQDRAAERAGLARMVYIRIETAQRHATVGQLEKIAAAFGMSVTSLLQRAERERLPKIEAEMVRTRSRSLD